MRSITITYEYSGDEVAWRATIDEFIAALNGDSVAAEKFSYQVAVADNGTTRIHWGRWDSADTLAHVQGQEYFKTFAGKVRDFSGGTPLNTGADIVTKTSNW